MEKFFSRLFSSASSSSKRGSYRGSQSSINDNGRKNAGQTTMRSASSLENISSYYINPKELDKNKLHKASWEGNFQKVERLAGPAQINAKDQHARVNFFAYVVSPNSAFFCFYLDSIAFSSCSRTYRNSSTSCS